jgi:hypothetical protein
MKVALDVNVSNYVIGRLAREGDQIVCVAKTGEDDQVWVERALDRDCDVIISQDLDVPNLLDKWLVVGVTWFEKVDDYFIWRRKLGKNKHSTTKPGAS